MDKNRVKFTKISEEITCRIYVNFVLSKLDPENGMCKTGSLISKALISYNAIKMWFMIAGISFK